MSTKIRFMVYNAYGIGGTIKTIFNFANYFYNTGKYDVEIISIKRTKDTPTLYINPKIKIISLQDTRRGAQFSDEDRLLLDMPSQLIDPEEDLYTMFNGYTDKKMFELLSKMRNGIFVTTMPSFNALSANMVDGSVLKIGQEHKSYADHTSGIQKLIRENYGKLNAITILTERNKVIYERKIQGEVPIYVLGNGTPLLNFRANLKNHIIIAAGRYSAEKGYDMLIRSFALIKDQFPDWTVKIYGEGTLTDSYIKIIRECGAENQIILEPGTDKLNEKLSEAAIQICSSYRESFGMAVIEGFAMGLPCVSFECDGPMEIITDGYDGVLVPKEDIKALSEAMAKLMSDETLRLEMGKNAYSTAKKYDILIIGKKLMQIVEKEINHKKSVSNVPLAVDLPTSMINTAKNGKVGLRTIVKMIFGWLSFKLKRKNIVDSEGKLDI